MALIEKIRAFIGTSKLAVNTRQSAQQGALASAISAQQFHALARLDAQRHRFEETSLVPLANQLIKR